jgi:thiamine biosynthesis lipoprotein ApbE
MQLSLIASSRGDAERTEAAVLHAIDRHDATLSAWRQGSELSQWLATHGVPTAVSADLFEVLGLFDRWRVATAGALNPAAEAAVRLWRLATSEQRRPSDAEIARVVQAIAQQHWLLDRANGTAMRTSDVPVALASLAKSYIAGRAVDAALAAGAPGVMLNIGGDIVVRGSLTAIVDIANPLADSENDVGIDRLVVRDRTVATSGSYRRGFDIAGGGGSRRPEFSHILDPRTAQPAGHILSSTVIAREPATAGALATAFSVMSVDESRELAAKHKGVEYLLLTREGDRIMSDGWRNYQAPGLRLVSYSAPKAAKAAAAAADVWNQGYELAVDVELPQPAEFRYRRPYVAVWIEGADHYPVRTLALWYDKARYLPELRDWSRDDQLRYAAEHTDIAPTVASATRSPGKYSLKWDGKDNQGKLVKPGKYTVCIEAAREHGGSQMLRQEIDFNGVAQQHALPAGSELGPVTLDYRKQ